MVFHFITPSYLHSANIITVLLLRVIDFRSSKELQTFFFLDYSQRTANSLFMCETYTLEYLITLQHLLNVHNGKLDFIWLAKKDNLMLLNQFKTFSINLNAQHVNGMTPFDLAVHMYVY